MKKLLLVPILGIIFSTQANAQSMSYTICESHSAYIRNAVEYRRQGMPATIPQKSILSTNRRGNEYLYTVLRESIDMAYSDPDKMEKSLNSGEWVKFCEAVLLNPSKYLYTL